LTTVHLGKKMKTYRALLNLANSWLSREILFFIFFLMSVLSDILIGEVTGAIILINGILLLISIDFLYLPVQWKWKLNIHSGQVIFIALSLWLFLSDMVYVFLFLSIFRVLLLIIRKRKNITQSIISISLKILLLIITSISIIPGNFELTGLISLLIFDVLERIDFYRELGTPEPELKI